MFTLEVSSPSLYCGALSRTLTHLHPRHYALSESRNRRPHARADKDTHVYKHMHVMHFYSNVVLPRHPYWWFRVSDEKIMCRGGFVNRYFIDQFFSLDDWDQTIWNTIYLANRGEQWNCICDYWRWYDPDDVVRVRWIHTYAQKKSKPRSRFEER